MELKEFVKETLTQIVEGITDANKEIQSKGAFGTCPETDGHCVRISC